MPHLPHDVSDWEQRFAGQFWLMLHHPGWVPIRKGPWPLSSMKAVLREFMAVNPDAFISVVTIGFDGPDVQDGPEALGMCDGRCWPTARKHIASSKAAHAAGVPKRRAGRL